MDVNKQTTGKETNNTNKIDAPNSNQDDDEISIKSIDEKTPAPSSVKHLMDQDYDGAILNQIGFY